MILQTRSEQVEIPDVLNARNVGKSIAGRRFHLKEIRKAGEIYLVQLTLFRAGWTQTEWAMLYPYNQFRLLDENDVPLLRQNTSAPGAGAEQVEVTLQYRRQDGMGEPARLVWELPTETKEVLIPFEFENLILP